ncbi:MAG: hypothetical protein OXF64_02470 [bacterium]|nr:hypothetical protein [bacterium]MCY4193111.1 hypothetical protein [bacterium]MCY4272409.1 hypothetical protein [bacterium]
MAETVVAETPFDRMDPEQVSGQVFALTRKGFDQRQVQAYLVSLGNQIKAGQQQIRDLREQVAQADALPAAAADFSSDGVRLLVSDVEASRRQTQAQAGETATQARRLAEELQTTVGELRGHQDVAEIAGLLEQACEQAQSVAGLLEDVRSQAEAEVEHGRAQGREIVEKAKALRLTVLRDMARRRQTARAQVERLRAGRDKLMSTLGEARDAIDQSMASARLSLAEAKVQADAAARRVEEEAEPTDLVLLSELDDAEELGMIPADPAAVESREKVWGRDDGEARGQFDEGVTPLPGAARDPVEAAGEHPVLAGAGEEREVEAIFARLRSQGGVEAPAAND